ncbi:hypothetical protein [Desulfosporosinus sp.]|nr:hypothetical protein [Desulfosporosinus sp.]MBC2722077.1 hypothetical protein [Desulfosporosinus sp.]MBC2726461.1 hypothetical protein [Desulfosporosinus sp.]
MKRIGDNDLGGKAVCLLRQKEEPLEGLVLPVAPCFSRSHSPNQSIDRNH